MMINHQSLYQQWELRQQGGTSFPTGLSGFPLLPRLTPVVWQFPRGQSFHGRLRRDSLACWMGLHRQARKIQLNEVKMTRVCSSVTVETDKTDLVKSPKRGKKRRVALSTLKKTCKQYSFAWEQGCPLLPPGDATQHCHCMFSDKKKKKLLVILYYNYFTVNKMLKHLQKSQIRAVFCVTRPQQILFFFFLILNTCHWSDFVPTD